MRILACTPWLPYTVYSIWFLSHFSNIKVEKDRFVSLDKQTNVIYLFVGSFVQEIENGEHGWRWWQGNITDDNTAKYFILHFMWSLSLSLFSEECALTRKNVDVDCLVNKRTSKLVWKNANTDESVLLLEIFLSFFSFWICLWFTLPTTDAMRW